MIEKRHFRDFIIVGQIITITTARIFFAPYAANVKSLKASTDAMDIMKIANGYMEGY